MARVRIARNDNELGTVDESELQTALDSGFRVVDDGEAKAVRQRRNAASASSVAIGTGEALARGASLGLSDVGLRALGVDMEAAQARRENLGTLGTTAELAGAVAPALLTGGGGAVGAAARLTPAGLAARAGAATERALAGGVGGRVLGAAGQGAVEGALAGAGQAASQDALGDRDLAVERLVAGGYQGIGMGALLGGGLGVAGRGLGYAAGGAGKLGRRAVEGLGERAESLSDLSPSEATWSGLGRAVARFQGRSPDDYGKLFGGIASRKGRDRILADMDEVTTSSARSLKETTDAYNEAFEGALSSISNARRGPKAAQLIAELDRPMRRAGGGQFARRPRSFIKEHLEQQNARIRAEIDDPLVSAETRNDLNEALRLNEQALRKAGENKAAYAYLGLDDYKRSMDAIAAKREKYYRANRSPETEKAWQRVRSYADDTRAHLEDESIYGPLALSQKRRNAALSAEFAAQESLPPQLRAFLEKGATADTATAMSLARGASRYSGQTKQDAFRSVLDARDDVFKMAREEGTLGPDELKALERAEAQGAALRAKLDDAAETAEVADLLQKARRDEGGGSPSLTLLSTFGPSAGAGLGFMLGGLPGAMFGAVAGTVLRPFTLAKGLAAAGNALERFRFGVDSVASRESTVARSLERLADGGRSAVRTASRASRRAAAGARPEENRSQRQARLLAVRAAVTAAASNPVEVATQMEESLTELHDLAPDVARGVIERSAVAVTFLASKAPDVYEPQFGASVQIVDPAALDRFERYVDAVSDPLGAVEKILSGGMALEHAEAIKVVYPKMFSELQQRVLEMVGRRKQEGRATSHEARVELGLLLDLPLDDSLQPGFLASIGQAYQAPPGAGAGPVRPASKPIEVSGVRTDLGRLEAGELRG